MKIIILALLLFAGCSETIVKNEMQSDSINANSISFSQEFISFAPISYEIGGVEGLKSRSVVYDLLTLDTNYNGYYCYGFQIHYCLTNEYEVNLGNGETYNISGVGSKDIHLFCNSNYEITITFIQ